MKILNSYKDIQNIVKRVRPKRIAVAYVGRDWEKYVDSGNLSEVIISPTIGSNPKEIEKMMQMIGEKNVHFLDKLHSKIYIGATSAFIGSPNLSNNGFSKNGLYEAGTLLEKNSSIKHLNTLFNKYKSLAKEQYPTAASKRKKLKQLLEQRILLARIKQIPETYIDSSPPPSLLQYESKLDRIHIAWHQETTIKYNKKSVNKARPETNNKKLDDYFEDVFMFHENDNIKKGDWILCWQCNNKGQISKDGKLEWMHVHDVIPKGIKDNYYTKLVGKIKGDSTPPVPFLISDPKTQTAIRNAINSGEFEKILPKLKKKPKKGFELWKIPTNGETVRFISYVKKILSP